MDVPVFAGCDRPLVVPPILAEHVHGKSGIDGVEPPITFIATGPLTNIAAALIKEPRSGIVLGGRLLTERDAQGLTASELEKL